MRYFIELAYKGTNYNGFQKQPQAKSVQTEVENALQIVLGKFTPIVGCGRTDTGVHAQQFFAHFDTEDHIENLLSFTRKINQLLKNDIVVFRIFEVDTKAHARFDAYYRKYEYHLIFEKNPFLIDQAYRLFKPLNFEQMQEAARVLLNYNDFKAFAKLGSPVNHFRCQLYESYLVKNSETHWIYHIAANRFLRNMVRAIMGTLLQIGHEKMDLLTFINIIEGKERSKAGKSAQAQGLFLTEVRYPFL